MQTPENHTYMVQVQVVACGMHKQFVVVGRPAARVQGPQSGQGNKRIDPATSLQLPTHRTNGLELCRIAIFTDAMCGDQHHHQLRIRASGS